MVRCNALTVIATILIVEQRTKHSNGFLLPREQSQYSCRPQSSTTITASTSEQSSRNDNTSNADHHLSESSNIELSRRDVCRSVIGTTAIIASDLIVGVDSVSAKTEDDLGYIPGIRPTAYRVDSTTPPTLIPVSSATKERKVLSELGRGSGTDKKEIKQDTLNLNNFMNKVVFGTIGIVSGVFNPQIDESKSGPGYASFVCMGVPSTTTTKDIDLASSLLSSIVEGRDNKKATALGLAIFPISVQPALDLFAKTGIESELQLAMKQSGITDETVELFMPLIRYAKRKSLEILAMSPEYEDIKAARTNGLASVDIKRRQSYVVDPEGFISAAKDPRYKLYTDRSLLKDFTPINADDDVKNFFAERIIVHEAGATAVAKYSMDRPESLVAIVAPTADLRYLGGLNGRIPRVYSSLVTSKNITNKVTDDAVTTILINPTASETLSAGNSLRLEIGTGPETLDYQTKVADYIWFSSSPKVNLIHRMMNG